MMQKLNDAGVPPNQIIQVTGHKNVNSLNNYSSVNETQQRDISRTLNPCVQNLSVPYSVPVPTPSASSTFPQTQVSKPCDPRPSSSDMLAGFFSNNHISGNIHVHLNSSNTQSNTSCVKTQFLHSPPPSPPVKKPFKRIRYIPSDSESD